MKKIILSIGVLVTLISTNAQDKTVQNLKNESNKEIKKDPSDTASSTWKLGGIYSLTFNQAALSNWAAGGDKASLSLASFLNAHAFYKKGKHSWDNTIDLAYGLVSTTSLGMRKADDRMDLLSKYGYDIGKNWYVSALFNFRTQFAKGYAYPDGKSKVVTSSFLAPAYILLSPGLNYKPNDEFSFFISPGTARWTIVNNDSLASVAAFGVDSGKHSLFQFGAFASTSYNKKISESATYTGRLDLFSNYLETPQNISLYWTNVLTVKVTKLISMSLTANMIYDNNIKTVKEDGTAGGPKPQLQELIGIGLSYKF